MYPMYIKHIIEIAPQHIPQLNLALDLSDVICDSITTTTSALSCFDLHMGHVLLIDTDFERQLT